MTRLDTHLDTPTAPPSVFDPASPEELAKALEEMGVPMPAEPPVILSGRKTGDPFKDDFRNFLFAVWKFLGLSAPTDLQKDIARYLQHGPDRKAVEGFRGVAKSWITAAFALWRLYCDQQERILVVSANLNKAKEFATFCLKLIREMPLLQHLEPGREDRQSAVSFDVKGARPAQSPSLRAAGITGQITGARASLIVADDVEVPANSMTVGMRDKLKEAIREFDAILMPGGEVVFLGTPQTIESIYNDLPKRGYSLRIWPARVPDPEQAAYYGTRLAPYVQRMISQGVRPGNSTEPTRFGNEDLAKRELSYGRSGFALQFMLDTRMEDATRFPLKLRDLIVMPLDRRQGPTSVTWGADPSVAKKDLPVIGWDGDQYYGPIARSADFMPWNAVKGYIDPSGRGSDETAYAFVAELGGTVFALDVGGFAGGYEPDTMRAIAGKLVELNCGYLEIEDNFGDGMFTAILTPYIVKAWAGHNHRAKSQGLPEGGTTIEGVRNSVVQKEMRIIDTLEPVMNGHRLVVDEEIVRRDFQEVDRRQGEMKQRHSLFYQMSHLTKERGSLPSDDRIEVLAGAVNCFKEVLVIDPEELEKRIAQEANQAVIDEWVAKWEMDGGGRGGQAQGTPRLGAVRLS